MLKIAFDRIDVTPVNNGLIGFTVPEKEEPARDSLFARLFLLQDDEKSSLIISLDYGGLYCSAHDKWRKMLAEAVNMPENRVILHCMHQHDAPFVNIEATGYLDLELDWSWFDIVKENVKNAAVALFDKLQLVDEIGWSETRVHGYASNRRVVMPDGSMQVRYSRCNSPEVRDMPVGIIDPMLRTLGFYGQTGELLAAWSFYTSHPQVANEGKRFSADAPGEAVRLLEQKYPGVINSFFNGCFGNITAGKYTSLTDLEGNIKHFGKIIADAVELNLQSMHKVKVERFSWEREVFEFPVRHFTDEELQKRSKTVQAALRAGANYGKLYGEDYAVELLTVGDVKIIFVNGELFVEYQLFAQGLIPDEKLAVVGNCGDTFYYIGTADALKDPAGYEVQSFCRAMPEFEELFKKSLRKLLL
ncbi:MAG: hypothetical protein E7039_09205 [Lentisphaerae bacterium]|nr:hypothetical protein [Lentisphaerota bacterium]